MSEPNKELLHAQQGMKTVHEQKEEPSLKGTFAAVMLLGGFLLISWLAVFILFLARQ
ncbi:hypothetical protein D3C73_515020 [compost metagenome]